MIEKDFLAQILATPHDDSLRLVYADWLEEQGNLERAQFIRAQCDIAKLPAWHPRAVEAAWEAEALLGKCGAKWRAELPSLDGIEWADFERGFVTMVHVRDQKALFNHAAAIADAAPVTGIELTKFDEIRQHDPERVPWLQTLRLDGHAANAYVFHVKRSILSAATALEIKELGQYENLDWLARRERGAPLERLEVQGNHIASSRITSQLLEHSPPAALRRLDLGTDFIDYDSGYYQDPTLGPEGAELIAARGFHQLEVLDLDRQRITQQGLASVLASTPRLRQLDVRRCELTEFSMFQAAEGDPILRLGLSRNELGDAGIRALIEAPRLASLESLELDTCEVTPDGVTALTHSPFWHTLRVLDLSRNALAVAGAVALTDAPRPENLHTLLLADCDFRADVVKLLADVPWLRNLAVLDLSSNELGDEVGNLADQLAGGSLKKLRLGKVGLDARPLSRSLRPLWESLWHLDVSGNQLGDEGLLAIMSEHPAALYSLDLSASGAGPALAKLVAAPLPRLHKLVLSGCHPTPEVLRALLASPLMQTLGDLDLSGCALTPADAKLIASSPAVAHLGRLNLRGNAFEDDEQLYLTLADSEHLRGVDLVLEANVWEFSDENREKLIERFGPGWHWHEDIDEDVENPYA
jgi:uncharacterized protein (TIGR02996 family)